MNPKAEPRDRSRVGLAMCLLLCCPALAADNGCVAIKASERLGVGLYFDQDMFVPATNKDRDYTMGLGIEFFGDDGPLYLLGDLLDRFDALSGLDRRCGRIYQSYLLGAQAFTPDDIGNDQPILDDRPYASLIYLSNKKVVADDRRALGLELTVGLLGLSVAEQVQTALHGWVRDRRGSDEPVDPAGWRYQVSNGGEPTLRLRLADSQRFAGGDNWDLAHGWDLNLGFQTNAGIGLSGRTGRLRSPFWSVPFDPINRGNFVPVANGDELYGWAAGRVRAVAYDALLQGQFRDSTVTVPSDQVRRLIWEFGAGITGSVSGYQITLSVNAKAGDTHLAGAPDNHVWGGLYLSRRYH